MKLAALIVTAAASVITLFAATAVVKEDGAGIFLALIGFMAALLAPRMSGVSAITSASIAVAFILVGSKVMILGFLMFGISALLAFLAWRKSRALTPLPPHH